MLRKTAFIEYRASSRQVYWLSFVFERKGNRVTIYEAAIHDKEGKFIGTWAAHNMPLSKLYEWRKLIQQWYPGDVEPEKDTTTLV